MIKSVKLMIFPYIYVAFCNCIFAWWDKKNKQILGAKTSQYSFASSLWGSPNSSSTFFAIILAMASDEVAPGEGAFRQCNTLRDSSDDSLVMQKKMQT